MLASALNHRAPALAGAAWTAVAARRPWARGNSTDTAESSDQVYPLDVFTEEEVRVRSIGMLVLWMSNVERQWAMMQNYSQSK